MAGIRAVTRYGERALYFSAQLTVPHLEKTRRARQFGVVARLDDTKHTRNEVVAYCNVMTMYRDDRSPLADWIIDAYEMIASEIGAQEDDQRFDTECAHDLLVAEGHDRMDAEYAIQRLLDRGDLYAVEGDLFVTEPDHSNR